MNNLNNKPIEGSSEELFDLLNLPFDLVDKIKIFLSTHPVPQSVLRTFHNMGL